MSAVVADPGAIARMTGTPGASADAKAFATLQATAALYGGSLIPIEGDDGDLEFVLTSGAATVRFRDLKSVAMHLRTFGGAQ